MDVPIAWLLDGPAYVAYRARRDLLEQPEDDPDVVAARDAMVADAAVQGLVADLADWPGPVVSSHKAAGQPFHKLAFLAELGLGPGDPGVDAVLQRVMDLRTDEGPFALPMQIGAAHGGTGATRVAWALCDAPLILYALASMGLAGDARVEAARAHLAGLVRAFGWPCAVSTALGTWRGPGRSSDPCPFANLAMLKALSAVPEWRDSPAARSGAEALLALWADSHSRHPYIFYMGTDFRKLKAPFVWYDLLHVADVLTRLPWLAGDPRLTEMVELIAGKADAAGRFKPESVWKPWSGWEFGQKKVPSRWLTLLAHRVLRRASAA